MGGHCKLMEVQTAVSRLRKVGIDMAEYFPCSLCVLLALLVDFAF